ncbi:MAG: DUF2125 domain-containing protein [Paracoccaceae bacterium]
MCFQKLPGASLTLAFAISAGAAQADVSAEQVWQAWIKQYEAYGYTVSTEALDESGDTLTAKGVVMRSAVEGSSFDITIPEIAMRETGSGTVEVSFSEEMLGIAITEVPEQAPLKMNIAMRQADMMLIVSGVPEALNYAFTMPEFVAELDQTVMGDAEAVPVKVWMSMTGGKGTYDVTEANGQTIVSQATLGGMRMTASGADPETGGTFAMEFDFSDMSYASNAVIPDGINMQDMGAALAGGAQFLVDFGYGKSTGKITADSPDGPVEMSSLTDSGTVKFEMSGQSLRYAGTGAGLKIDANIATLPMPVSAKMASSEFDFAMPVGPSEESQPLIGKLVMSDLVVSDELWALFDPMQQLPRDPATLVIDLSGKGRAMMNLFSPEAAQMPVPPIQVEQLDINALRLDLAGAELTGTGALSFDNAMGMPMPVGKIDLRLAGANGLMGTLTAMGLLPEDQAMFARMMMGLYAVPVGEDEVTSTIEFKEGGEVLANGQRIQ